MPTILAGSFPASTSRTTVGREHADDGGGLLGREVVWCPQDQGLLTLSGRLEDLLECLDHGLGKIEHGSVFGGDPLVGTERPKRRTRPVSILCRKCRHRDTLPSNEINEQAGSGSVVESAGTRLACAIV